MFLCSAAQEPAAALQAGVKCARRPAYDSVEPPLRRARAFRVMCADEGPRRPRGPARRRPGEECWEPGAELPRRRPLMSSTAAPDMSSSTTSHTERDAEGKHTHTHTHTRLKNVTHTRRGAICMFKHTRPRTNKYTHSHTHTHLTAVAWPTPTGRERGYLLE